MNDRLVRVYESVSGLGVDYQYDTTGDLVRVVDSKGRAQSYEYDYDSTRSDDGNWTPEQQVRATCENVCAPSTSSCDAGGACDAPIQEAWQSCLTTCGGCASDCKDEVCSGCTSACGNGNAESAGCVAGCESECTPADGASIAKDECEQVWDDRAEYACEYRRDEEVCDFYSDVCGGLSAKCEYDSDGATSCNLQGGGLDWLEAGTYGRLIGATLGYLIVNQFGCALSVICWTGWCDASAACNDDTASRWLAEACNDNVTLCCKYGQNCAESSCNAGQSFMGQCKATFMGTPRAGPAGLPTDLDQESCLTRMEWDDERPTGPSYDEWAQQNGCVPRLTADCNSQCSSSCMGECIPDCQAACQSQCDATCDVGECSTHCTEIDLAGACQEGCVDGCIDELHARSPQGTPKYGQAGDLNHNIIRIRDGNGRVYLENTYGTDLEQPNFDSVITQNYGGYPIELFYRDLANEEAGYISPPASGPAREFVSTSGFTEIDICPNTYASSSSSSTQASAMEFVPYQDLLFGFPAGVEALRVVRPQHSRGKAAPTILQMSKSGGKVLARATSEETGPHLQGRRMRGFSLVLASGTLRFRARAKQSYIVTGPKRARDELLRMAEVTLVGDRRNGVQVIPGHPISVLHVAQGQCSKPFSARRVDGKVNVELSPSDACDGKLLVTPLASAVEDEQLKLLWVGMPSAIAKRAFGRLDLLQATPLLSGRGAVSLALIQAGRRASKFQQRAASASLTASSSESTIVNVLQHIPLMAMTGESDNFAAPLYVFHASPKANSWGQLQTFGDLRFPVDAYKPQPSGGSHGESPILARVVIDYHGIAWTYYLNELGRVIRKVNNDTGAIDHYNFDEAGRMTGHQDPLGGKTCFVFDASGNMSERLSYPIPSASGSQESIRWHFSYVPNTNALQAIYDPRSGDAQTLPSTVLGRLQWNNAGNLVATSNGAGETTRYRLVGGSDANRASLSETISASGGRTQFAYDLETGQIRQTVLAADSESIVTTSRYDSAGNILSQAMPLGAETSFEWQDGQLQSTTSNVDGLSAQMRFEYDNNGQRSKQSRADRSTSFSYDAIGNLHSVVTTPLKGQQVSQCFDTSPDGRLLESVNGEGGRASFVYDSNGQVTEVHAGSWGSSGTWDDSCTSFSGMAAAGLLVSNKYDLNGRLVESTDAMNITTVLQYDGFGRVIVRQQGMHAMAGVTEHIGYDQLGNVVWRAVYDTGYSPDYGPPSFGVAGLLEASEMEYDASGRLVETQAQHFDTLGNAVGDGYSTSRLSYDTSGRSMSVTDDNGALTTTHYDQVGRMVRVELPTGGEVNRAYLNGGKLISETKSAPTPSGVSTSYVELSAAGAPLRSYSTDAGSTVVFDTWLYDKRQRLIEHTDVAGATTHTSYNALDQIVSQTKQTGSATARVETQWNRNGQVSLYVSDTGQSAKKATASFSYDALGRQVLTEWANSSASRSQYVGASSSVQQVVDEAGVATRYHYDLLGRPHILQTSGPGVASQSRAFVYDALGRLLHAEQYGAMPTWSPSTIDTYREWDSLGNMTHESNNLVDEGVDHEYDGIGNQVVSTYANRRVDRNFDSIGRLNSLWLDGDSQPAVAHSYAGLGPALRQSYASSEVTDYERDAFGRLVGLALSRESDNRLLARQEWEIPADGVPRIHYDYRDALGDLDSAYQVDVQGRLTAETHGITTGSQIRLPTAQASGKANSAVASMMEAGNDWTQYILDGRGNWQATFGSAGSFENPSDNTDAYQLFQGVEPSYDERGALIDDGEQELRWDSFANIKAAGTTEYVQDALGRVVGERVNNRETWYSYDGLNKSIRWRGKKSRYGSRTKVDFTLHGAGFDKHYLTFTDYKQDEVVFYHQDRMGSVYGLSSRRKPGSNLRIAEWNYYTAYGEATSFRSDGSPQPPGEHQSAFGFQGHRQDASTGLVDMRARMYKPAWGRFVQRDPIGLAGGSNQLAFVHSSPLKYTDPSGLDAGWFRDHAGENMLRLRQYGLGAMIPAVLPAGMSYGRVPKHFEQPNTGIAAKISSALLVADNTLRLSENGHRIGRVALGFEIAAGGCLLTAGIGCYASVLHGSDIAASGVTGGDTMVSRGARFAGIDPYYAEMFVGILTLSAVALEAAIAARAQPLVMGMLDDGVGAVKVAKGGTGAYLEGTGGGQGLGRLTGREIRVSEQGLAKVEQHVAQFGDVPQNTAMVGRLRSALSEGRPITGADASFYMHEASEATMMARGMSYPAAHGSAISKYGVSPFSVYHPEVVSRFKGYFNSNWFNFWGL